MPTDEASQQVMQTEDPTQKAIDIGQQQAREIVEFRKKAVAKRETEFAALSAGGVLVAEGDSWFDYPFHDIVRLLEDEHAYDVRALAHKGDRIEEMAYGGSQLEELTRLLQKLLKDGVTPKAILLSGGGNDVAGAEFGMLLNHERSAIAGLNQQIVAGVVDQRIRSAYLTILSAVTEVCVRLLGRRAPILVHGYDYPVPDGRGVLGGWWWLPGPWLEPGFREKGFEAMPRRIELAGQLIDRLNVMLQDITSLGDFAHVKYVDLRGTLSIGQNYRHFWANELHPTEAGFRLVTDKFAAALQGLPSP